MVPRDYVDEVISSLFEDAVDPKISGVGAGGFAMWPCETEGRAETARQGLGDLRREADSVIVVENDSLNRFADQLPFNEAMQIISYMVVTIVQGVVEHLSKSYLTTLAEEVENAAKEIEEQNNHAVPVEVQPAESVEAAWDLGPVAFNDQGFIGLRAARSTLPPPTNAHPRGLRAAPPSGPGTAP